MKLKEIVKIHTDKNEYNRKKIRREFPLYDFGHAQRPLKWLHQKIWLLIFNSETLLIVLYLYFGLFFVEMCRKFRWFCLIHAIFWKKMADWLQLIDFTTDKRTDVWSRDFIIWKINSGLWAVGLGWTVK